MQTLIRFGFCGSAWLFSLVPICQYCADAHRLALPVPVGSNLAPGEPGEYTALRILEDEAPVLFLKYSQNNAD